MVHIRHPGSSEYADGSELALAVKGLLPEGAVFLLLVSVPPSTQVAAVSNASKPEHAVEFARLWAQTVTEEGTLQEDPSG